MGALEVVADVRMSVGKLAPMAGDGPERVKTRSHWELTKPVSDQGAAFRLRQPDRQITADHIANAQQPPYGRYARIAFITASEPSSLITRFMLYASTCKLISVLTRPMVRVRK